MKQSTTLKTMVMKFQVALEYDNDISFWQLGVECDDVTPDGREVKMKVIFDQGKMVMVQKAKNPKEKSTKVGESPDESSPVEPGDGGARRAGLHHGGDRPPRELLRPEIQKDCLVI